MESDDLYNSEIDNQVFHNYNERIEKKMVEAKQYKRSGTNKDKTKPVINMANNQRSRSPKINRLFQNADNI